MAMIPAPAPLNSLAGFQRVNLAKGQTKTLSFSIPAERLMLVGEDGQSRQEAGKFRLTVGSCSPGGRGQQLGAAPALVAEFQALFASGTPTAEQFAALRAKVAAENFSS